MNSFKSHWLGEIEYRSFLELQESLLSKKKGNILLGGSHPQVITLGLRANTDEDLINKKTTIPIISINRGGRATIHSPGQLLIYPLFNLRSLNISVKSYIEKLFLVTQSVCSLFGVDTFVDMKNVGLYTINGKIASVGIRISKGVSSHGLSINISNNLTFFDDVYVCGNKTKAKMDKLQNYKIDIDLKYFFEIWKDSFIKLFNIQEAFNTCNDKGLDIFS